MSLKTRAASSVVKHTVHGTVSKAKRRPVRATRLLTFGAVLGGLAGYLAGRRTTPAPAPVVHATPTTTTLPPAPTTDGKPPAPAKAAPKRKPAPDMSAAIDAVQAAAAKRDEPPLPPPD